MNSESLVALVLVNRPVTDVWEYWTQPSHIMQWHVPTDEWQCTAAENNLVTGGRFCIKMEPKKGTERFEYAGVYQQVVPFEMIAYSLNDGRKALVEFQQIDHNTIVRKRFEPELKTKIAVQTEFYQSVLNSFKNYVESQ